MNKSGLIIVGAAIALVGYALVASGLSTLKPDLWGSSFSTLDALIPGRLPGSGGAVSEGFSNTKAGGGTVGSGGGTRKGVQ